MTGKVLKFFGTNPRNLKINPRALGVSPRQLEGLTPEEVASNIRKAAHRLLQLADKIENCEACDG